MKKLILALALCLLLPLGALAVKGAEDEILDHSVVARLLSFPNVIVTSHQAFLTEEALKAISCITMDNALSFIKGTVDPANQVC